jgi:hypothetical protein
VGEGLTGQTSVELEGSEEAAGANTEFPEPVAPLAGRSVEAEAEGDLDLHVTTLSLGHIPSAERSMSNIYDF